MSLKSRKSDDSIEDEVLLHYWLFGADNVSQDMNEEFWHKELQPDSKTNRNNLKSKINNFNILSIDSMNNATITAMPNMTPTNVDIDTTMNHFDIYNNENNNNNHNYNNYNNNYNNNNIFNESEAGTTNTRSIINYYNNDAGAGSSVTPNDPRIISSLSSLSPVSAVTNIAHIPHIPNVINTQNVENVQNISYIQNKINYNNNINNNNNFGSNQASSMKVVSSNGIINNVGVSGVSGVSHLSHVSSHVSNGSYVSGSGSGGGYQNMNEQYETSIETSSPQSQNSQIPAGHLPISNVSSNGIPSGFADLHVHGGLVETPPHTPMDVSELNVNVPHMRLGHCINRDLVNYINEKPSLEQILSDNENTEIKWTCRKATIKSSMIRGICESKEGSKYLQTILDETNEDIIRTFLNKIWLYSNKLCINTAGHYVIMKLLSICQSKVSLISLYFKFIDEIICQYLTNMINNIYAAQIINYSLHCHNVNIQNYALYQISYTLTKYGTTLIHNASTNVCGNRIIQSVIEKSVFNCNLPKKPIRIITDYVVNNILTLCNHQYACRVVQAIIKCHEINKECINQLLYYLPKVCNNSNGNYSIQMCLEYSTLSKRSEFIEEIFFGQNSEVVDYSKQGKYTLPSNDINIGMSSNDYDDDNSNDENINNVNDNYYGKDDASSYTESNKIHIKPNYEKFLFGQYSSHVCDKAFQLASMSQKMRLIKCLICCNNNTKNIGIINNRNENDLTNTVMYKLMHHQFGNYVVRNILYHLLKLNNGNGKYLRRIVFNYLLKIQSKLILSQREISFTYAKHILDMIDRHAM